MTKLLYCIRHGTALHNVNFSKMGRKAYTEFKDTPLIDLGKLEAVLLGTTWKDIDKVELILVSPLTRTLDTAKFIFQHHKAPIIALDYLMEHPQAEEICNLRANKEELSLRYPNVDFSNLSDNSSSADIRRELFEGENIRTRATERAAKEATNVKVEISEKKND